MLSMKHELKVCLWFDGNAEEAAKFYIDVFKDAKIINRSFYGNEGFEYHGKTPGTLLTIELQLKSFNLLLLNGDHSFKFNEAMSLVITCDTQEEVDYYWQRLTYKGDPSAQVCGWLKDQFGLSWQVVPTRLDELLNDPNPKKVDAVSKVMFNQSKIIIKDLEDAYQNA